MSARDRVMQVAIKEAQARVREDPPGSNDGLRVRQYIRACGLSPGVPWCLCFVVWVFRQAGVTSDVLPSLASASGMFRWASEHRKVTHSPRGGDIFLLRGGSTGFRHGGITKSRPILGMVRTVEGNTGPDPHEDGEGVIDARGGGVFFRWRRVSSCAFVSVLP